jgi:hypothetical protein
MTQSLQATIPATTAVIARPCAVAGYAWQLTSVVNGKRHAMARFPRPPLRQPT